MSYDDTSKMKTLDNCIKEAMRLYPAAPLIGRRCVKEDKIGPYVIPANTELFIDLGSLFRSEERWKRPDEYNPDRFNEKGMFLAISYRYVADEKTRGEGEGVLDLNLYGGMPTKKNFFTLLQNFLLQMIPGFRKSQSKAYSKKQKFD